MNRPAPIFITDAEILPGRWRNFSGAPTQFNAAGGKRNLFLKIEPELAQVMIRDGLPVKEMPPREEGDEVGFRLEIHLGYNGTPPEVWYITGGRRTLLDEQSVGILDNVRIQRADIKINPSPWEVNGKTGIKCWLNKLYVTAVEDELDAMYRDMPIAGLDHNEPSGVHFE